MNRALDDFPLLRAARLLWEQGARAQSLARYEQAIASVPESIRALVEAGQAYGLCYRIQRGEELLRKAEAKAGGHPRILPTIAESYLTIQRPRRALALLEQLRERAELPPPMWGMLAVLYEQTNQIDAALAAVSKCLALAPDQPEPQLILARLERRGGDEARAEQLLLALVGRREAPPLLHVRAWYEICQLRDRRGDYAGAVEAVERAKNIQRSWPQTETLWQKSSSLNEKFQRIYEELDAGRLTRWNQPPWLPDARCGGVAHLLGFPRSGTTLLEQVLDAHPGLVDAAERPVFAQLIFPAMYRPSGTEPLSLASLDAISPERIRELRSGYLDVHEALLGEPLGGRVLLDKNPNHTSLLAGILRLFPESRLLFALRDPRDVVVSAYLQFFPLTEFSANFLTWEGTCRAFAHDLSIWLRVRTLIEGQFLEVRYEDVVDDLADQARRTLDFLGLPWDAGVLDYRTVNAEKIVHSPSHADVRQPVYRRAIGRWEHYRKQLEPHLAILEPYVAALGYG